MDNAKLTQFYDDLKNKLDNDNTVPLVPTYRVGGGQPNMAQTPGAIAWRRKASNEAQRLKDDCCKHILLDIYCKILPLDSDYVCGHQGQMKSDVDGMLANKGISATKYFMSCFESTSAPLVGFILHAGDMISRQFMEEAEETLKDAQKNDVSIPAPEADIDSKEIQDQLVDVKNDSEYETFIDKLKEKTVNKIVSDVSKIINNKKEEKEMTFDPKPEVAGGDEASAFENAMNYMERKFMLENVNIPEDIQNDMIGMAIREATLHQIDLCFNQPGSDARSLRSKITLGKGYVVNESTASYLTERAK